MIFEGSCETEDWSNAAENLSHLSGQTASVCFTSVWMLCPLTCWVWTRHLCVCSVPWRPRVPKWKSSMRSSTRPVTASRTWLASTWAERSPKVNLKQRRCWKWARSLTTVGELILDTDRLPKIRPPTDGSEYFLSTDDFETLLLEQEGQAEVWRVLACVCALAGVAVLMWAGRRYYRQLKLRWEQESMRREFELMGAGERGEEENGVDVAENACVICLSNPRGCVLLDCGHVCCCFRCYQALPQPTCPICRQNIKRVVPLYQA